MRRLGLVGVTIAGTILLAPPTASAAVTAVDTSSAPGFDSLDVRSDAASDSIVLTCDGGMLEVNDADPSTGAMPCAALDQYFIHAGAGNDVVDVSSLTRTALPNVGLMYIEMNLGNDRASGSAMREFMNDGPGDEFGAEGGRDNFVTGPGGGAAWTGSGADRVIGGDANTQAQGGPGNDILRLGDGRNSGSGGAGQDRIVGGEDSERMNGGPGGDTLISGGGADSVGAQAGADVVRTGAGDDQVRGGPGVDRLFAGGGDDVLSGGYGRAFDLLVGGPGFDIAVLRLERNQRLRSIERIER